LFAQTDLKRIVALTTVIEMNWLNLCFVLGDVNLMFLANFLIVAHCFTTTSEFLLVEFISKRYGTRDF
jgi:formate hydrogenlyase subunit 3/multisubunit Na+/H+ antiporter MnhD subunit